MHHKHRLDSSFLWQWNLPITARQVQSREPLFTGQYIVGQSIVNSGQGIGVLDSRIIEPSIVDTEPGAPSFFVISTIGEDHGLSLGSIWPPVSISATHSSSFFIFWGDIRRGAQLIGDPSPVLISCSTTSVWPVNVDPGMGNRSE